MHNITKNFNNFPIKCCNLKIKWYTYGCGGVNLNDFGNKRLKKEGFSAV